MANLSGHDSHGVGMAPRYVDAVLEGNLKPNASVLIQKDHGMMLGLDGGTGYGQIVGVQAMALAFERASQHGCCIFSLSNAHHLGRIGHYAKMAVTVASGPTPAVLAYLWVGEKPPESCLYLTLPPAESRRARCASPITKGAWQSRKL